MSIVAIVVCFSIAIFSYLKERNIVNPVTIMSGIWGIISFLANLRLFRIYGGSDLTYFLISMGIVMFAIGAFINQSISLRLKINSHRLINRASDYKYNYHLLYSLCVISFLIMLYPAIVAGIKVYVFGNSLSYVRNNIELYNVTILNAAYNYLAFPFSIAIIPIYSLYFFTVKKRNKWLGLFVILIIIERVMIEGGRFLILYLVCDLSISYMITKRKQSFKLNTKAKIAILSIMLFSVGMIFYITTERGIDNFWDSIYIYFCGVIPHLSKRLDIIQHLHERTFGMASLNGFFEFIFTMSDNIGLGQPSFFSSVKALSYVEDRIIISGNGMTFNAFVGPFYYLFLDGRFFGVGLGMLIWGEVSNHFYKHIWRHDFNLRSAAVYVLLAQAILLSMVRIEFANIYYVMSFVYIFLIIRRKT